MAIPYSQWMATPLETRIKIASVMGIPKLRSTHVADNQVLDDGYNIVDVENALKVPSLQNYLKSSETDVFKLFQMLIDTVNGKPLIEMPQVEIKKEDIVPDNVIKVKPIKKRGRKPKAK